jgi:hypothetical protein
LGGALKMLAERLFQFLKDLEVLHQLEWEVERVSSDSDALRVAFNTFFGKFWFRVDIDPQKDKPFRYFFSHTSQPIEAQTKEEVAAWLLADFTTFYALLLLQQVLKPMLGRKPFVVPINTYIKDNQFYLVANEIAIVTTYIIKRPQYNENGIVTVQVPQSLLPEGFYAALAYNKEGEMLIRLNNTYPTVVHALERMLALSAL